jgi:hypothetical protein
MDILRTDGAIMRADGTMIRAAINFAVGRGAGCACLHQKFACYYYSEATCYDTHADRENCRSRNKVSI